MRTGIMLIIRVFALFFLIPHSAVWPGGFPGGVRDALGPDFDQNPRTQRVDRSDATLHLPGWENRLRHWHELAMHANALDHTPVAAGENRVFGEQLGPARSSRAMAISHIAMFDTINAITREAATYTNLASAPADASIDAAISQAAHDTLVVLYPSQAANLDEQLANDLGTLQEGNAKSSGIDLGQRVAAAILALRANDGSQREERRIGIDFITGSAPGEWRQDPISRSPLALGADWGSVKPFAIASATEFRAPPPPALSSAEYATAFDEVKRLGGDGLATPTERTPDQTIAGIYWGYDGTANLGTPPRLYNEIVLQIADQRATKAADLARLLALVNVALADTAIALWESKYHYRFWRPITGIREADEGTGPSGLGDGNPATTGDPNFTPLGAPASNLLGPNFTPPFPSYPSGHAGFGGAVFQTLRRFYGTDQIAFTFVSDEYNGVTLYNNGELRPRIPRSFSTLSQAEDDNGQSRIYLGIHWAFDKVTGIAQGRSVADYVFAHAFLPHAESSGNK